jgi:ribonuclease BN (tRNA processing enzyme)
MKIRFLGAHNTETQQTRLPGLLIDGLLALDAGSLTSSLALPEQLRIQAVLLTHRHFDHMRDIPTLGMNCFLNGGNLTVYGSPCTRQALAAHILNGEIYSRFLEKPFFTFHQVEAPCVFDLGDYRMRAVTVRHSVPAQGYLVSARGHSLFYTGDTGPGLAETWQKIRPELLIIEVTAANQWTEYMRGALHLTPELLNEELLVFHRLKGYFPRVVTVHMNPSQEETIRLELGQVARELGAEITVGFEGLEVCLESPSPG